MDSTLPMNESKSIQNTHHFDLIYTQSGYFYILLPTGPHHCSLKKYNASTTHAVNDIIGTMTHKPGPPRIVPLYGDPSMGVPSSHGASSLVYAMPYFE